jgi:hypothetical protein
MTRDDQALTVGELMTELAKYEPDTIIVLSRDPEGNGYSPAYNCEGMNYEDGEVGYGELTEDLKDAGYGEEDIRSGVPALVIWPLY